MHQHSELRARPADRLTRCMMLRICVQRRAGHTAVPLDVVCDALWLGHGAPNERTPFFISAHVQTHTQSSS